MGILDALFTPLPGFPNSTSLLGGLAGPAQTTRRRVYFAFDFDDVMRVNNVRNAWAIHHPSNALFPSFQDSSLWESRKLEGIEALKGLMRSGVEYTSAVCVLVGSLTYLSRWVRYEIARAVIDNRGLLAVHINGLKHHQRFVSDFQGPNPLQYLGVCQTAHNVFRLYEQRFVMLFAGYGEWQWHPYDDYTCSVDLPRYLPRPDVGYIMRLSVGAAEHDYVVGGGRDSIGRWIDDAAIAVGR